MLESQHALVIRLSAWSAGLQRKRIRDDLCSTRQFKANCKLAFTYLCHATAQLPAYPALVLCAVESRFKLYGNLVRIDMQYTPQLGLASAQPWETLYP